MPTNRLLVASAFLYAVPGLALLFAPFEVLRMAGLALSPAGGWLAGILGSALLAFAMLHWYQRHTMIGGIYGRPLLLANVLLLCTTTFSSFREWRTSGVPLQLGVTLVAGVLLVAFWRLMFVSPKALGTTGTASRP